MDFKVDLSDLDMSGTILEIKQNLKRATIEAGTAVENQIKKNIHEYYDSNIEGTKTISQRYRRRLELKGKVPHKGLISDNESHAKLHDNINGKPDASGVNYVITCGVDHGKYLEEGTKKAGKRPFFYVALKQCENKVDKIFEEAFSK